MVCGITYPRNQSQDHVEGAFLKESLGTRLDVNLQQHTAHFEHCDLFSQA